jgi:hypothetical protein
MFCSKCGSKNVNDSVFCNKCGTKIETNHSDKMNTDVRSEEKNSRKIVYKGEVHKCPNCGENLKSFEAICPSCGCEIRTSSSSNTLVSFIRELQSLESKKVIKGKGKQLVESLGFGTSIDVDKQKINLIRNFIVPSNTEDLFEFLIFASSNINIDLAMEDFSNFESASEDEINSIKAINDTWMEKAKQVYQKLQITSKAHPKFSSVEAIYLDKINGIKVSKVNEINKKKRRLFFYSIGFVVILIISVIIWPYVLKFMDPELIVPVSSSGYIGRNYEDVILELEDLGFVNLVINEIEMSASDSSKTHGTIVQMSFQGLSSFEAETKIRSRTRIEITYYVIKHTISVQVEFEPNWLFNKYDVNMMVNGAKKGTIMHGKNTNLTFRIRAGKNVITFANTEDSNVNGSVNIMVDGDLNVTYRITALKDNVTIEKVPSLTETFIPNPSIIMNDHRLVMYFYNRRIVGHGYF